MRTSLFLGISSRCERYIGNFTMMPKEMRHFAVCKGETIVQIHGAGPFKVNWVNPFEVIPPEAKVKPTDEGR